MSLSEPYLVTIVSPSLSVNVGEAQSSESRLKKYLVWAFLRNVNIVQTIRVTTEDNHDT